MRGGVLRTIGIVAFLGVGLVISVLTFVGILAAVVYQALWLWQVLGWWGIALQLGWPLLLLLLVSGGEVADFFAEKWNDWRWSRQYRDDL